MSVLDKPYFSDEAAAVAKLESIVWPKGPTCPHCGNVEGIYELKGKTTRIGLKKCKACRKQFTVRVGTVFESSHIPLHKWFQAVFLMCSSKKGISAHQLHRTLEITYKSAWFMSHRIREAMRVINPDRFGGFGAPVEADETFIGHDKDKPKPKAGYAHKHAVLSLIDRNSGKVHSRHVANVKAENLREVLFEQIYLDSTLMTDDAYHYRPLGTHFTGHKVVKHSKGEYVRGDAHTNTLEGFFSIFKRGMKGVYQHCSKEHLHRYLAEFDFRYNERAALGVDDIERMFTALVGAKGKRLTYRRADA
jgi:transposase-like protein